MDKRYNDPEIQRKATDILDHIQNKVSGYFQNLQEQQSIDRHARELSYCHVYSPPPRSLIASKLGVAYYDLREWCRLYKFWIDFDKKYSMVYSDMVIANLTFKAQSPFHKDSIVANKALLGIMNPEMTPEYLSEKAKLTLKVDNQDETISILQERVKQFAFSGVEQFPNFCKECLIISDKNGKSVPFIHNKPQRKLFRKILEYWQEGKPIRFIVLKARQLGFTTFIIALKLFVCIMNKGFHGIVMAHDQDASSSIFSKLQSMYNNWQPQNIDLRPDTMKSNTKMLEFNNKFGTGLGSTCKVFNAKKEEVRGGTTQFVHQSERAFYPSRVLDKLDTSCKQQVPLRANTFIFYETTADGQGSPFHHEWMEAVDNPDKGFYPFFFPWHEMIDCENPEDDYVKNFRSEKERRDLLESLGKDMRYNKYEGEETELQQMYDLTDEQLNWRRYVIDYNFAGRIRKFDQEYPHCPEVAFISTGTNFFDLGKLEELRKFSKSLSYTSVKLSKISGEWRMVKHDNGYLKVWKKPEHGRQYFITVDPAEGEDPLTDVKDPKGKYDYHVMDVWDIESREQVAQYRGYCKLGELCSIIYAVSYLYGGNKYVEVMVERNNHGHAVIHLLAKYKEIRLYIQDTAFDEESIKQTFKVGWRTSNDTKSLAWDMLDISISNWNDPLIGIKIRSEDTINELVTGKQDPRTKQLSGYPHDDTITTASMFAVIMYLRYGKILGEE